MNTLQNKDNKIIQKIKEFRLMDANILEKGEDYDKLPESYVIFITENDVMEGNLPVYHADRIVAETGKPLGEKARFYKEDSKGVTMMCRIMEELIAEEKKEMILRLKKLGKLSNEEIAEYTGLTVKEVEDILEQAATAV